uniref:DNA-directed RNA polymerase n=1 Tax=Lepocinclis ovum TaxID=86638 RepID=A0A3G3LLZ1_9EUGL|nr:RNA polymerase beta'' subunit [Lepocinclis ovum]AYQ93718.1 RNA polymerase beta'' subunit [Lepocinclis ovum]
MKEIICNKTFDKKQITKLIEWFIYNYGTIRTGKLINKLKFIGFKYSTISGLSLGPEDLIIPKIKSKLIKNTKTFIENKEKKYKAGKITKQNLLQKEIETWNLVNNTLKDEIIKNFRQTNLLNPVYMMIFSGARGNIAQIKQLVGMRGLMSDSKGEIINIPIKSSLKEGLKSKEYFISCYGARKGIIDTALKTANSGYLTRKLIYVAQNLIIKQQDCKTKKGLLIKLYVKKKENYTKLKNKLIGSIISENITNKNNKNIICKGQDICPYIAKKIIKHKLYIYVRSVLTCNLNIGICQLCYGWNLGNNKLVRIGEAVGILAAQSIGEPGTQLTMRTFHTGGIFTSKTNKVITAPHNGTIIYNQKENGIRMKNKFDENLFFILKEKEIYVKQNKKIISKIYLPKHSTIFFKPNKKVFKKQIIAEVTKWRKKKRKTNEIREIKSHSSGISYFQNDKYNHRKLWIINGHVINSKQFYDNLIKQKKNYNLLGTNKRYFSYKKNNNIKLTRLNYKNSKLIKNRQKNIKKEERKVYKLIRLINKQERVVLTNEKLQVIYALSNLNQKNKIPKLGKFLSNFNGQILKIMEDKITVEKSIPYVIPKYSKTGLINNELIEKNRTLFKSKYEKEKTKDIIEGLPKVEEILETKKNRGLQKIKGNPHERLEKTFLLFKKKYNSEIANRKSIEKIQRILVKQVQKVYQLQDVNIAEKHISTIIRQMTSKVIIRQSGNSSTLEGEIIDINKIEKINKCIKSKAIYEPILLGISKASLINDGFISAACFQETIRVLSKSAIRGRIDWLIGLKENIILGNLIPAGTGVNITTINLGV